MTSTTDLSHRHFAAFSDWIRPESGTRDTIIEQAAEIRRRIKAKAEEDGLTVIATPNSGSFAKKTGLRRHMRGDTEVEGQDVDLPFVLKPTTKEGDRVDQLLAKFDGYAKASYPTTERKVTKSSVELNFIGTKLRYDLVPMLSTNVADYQIILKGDRTRRLTSISKHTAFVTGRTDKSNATAGRVAFNECVRLLKWWRCVRLGESHVLDKVSTMHIELLCAYAFDHHGVSATYTDTLLAWFSRLAHVTAKRIEVKFSDYQSVDDPEADTYPSNASWRVLDPVNDKNNLVPLNWQGIELREFAEWFESARDKMTRIVALEREGETTEVETLLSELFGPAIITHGAKK
jgi:hypothetical protein